MKKMITITLVLVLLAVSFGGSAEDARRTAIDALIAEWKQTYQDDWSWDVSIEEGTAPADETEIQQEEALALAIEAICEVRDIDDIGFFQHNRPFFGFQKERVWVLSILPTDVTDNVTWGFWVSIDAATGECILMRQAEPMGPDDFDTSPGPKG